MHIALNEPSLDCPPRRQVPQSCSGNQQRITPTRRRPDVALPTKYRNRPGAVRQAIYRVWEMAPDAGFTRSTVALLQAILATGLSVTDPYQPIFAKKKRLAQLAGISEASVYRGLAQLQDGGWINRRIQQRLEDGSMDLGLIVITNKLAQSIGVIVVNNTEIPTADVSSNLEDTQLAMLDDCCTSTNNKTAILTIVSNTNLQSDGAKNQPKEESLPLRTPSFQPDLRDGLRDGPIYRRNGFELGVDLAVRCNQSSASSIRTSSGHRLPQELYWLVDEGRLSIPQLLRLMGDASKAEKRLSDIVEARSDRLRTIDPGSPCFRYLRTLIGSDTDFKEILKRRHQAIASREKQRIRREKIESRLRWVRDHANLRFIDGSGMIFQLVGETGRVNLSAADKPFDVLRSLKITAHFIAKVAAGQLSPYEIPVEMHKRAAEHGRSVLASYRTLAKTCSATARAV